MRNTIKNIINKDSLICLTAYTAPFAKILDNHADIILVGDTVAMVVYGEDSTLNLDIETMIRHGRAVVNASKKSLVVIDMPFGSYQESPEQAFRNAAKIMKETSASAVKIEGGIEMANTIDFLTKRGIPVMAHIGLMPQKFNSYGGFITQGKNNEEKKNILADAKAVEDAGAFAVVLECVKTQIAKEITKKLEIPTIGIGSSVNCNGQIIVTEDIAGLFTEFTPKFVKKYGNLAFELEEAVKEFVDEVKSKKFPGSEHSFN